MSRAACDLLRVEHRAIEAPLDRLLVSIGDPGSRPMRRDFAETWSLALRNLEKEERILYPRLRKDLPAVVEKMERQHADLRELAENLEALLSAEDLCREETLAGGLQFCALLQHHMIEEERDLLHLAERVLSAEEDEELARALSISHRPANNA